MGATLEQFELTAEDYGGLRGQVPRGARAQPSRRDRGRAQLDARGRRGSARDRHLPGLADQARASGAWPTTRSRSTPRRRKSRARRPARTASSPARSGRRASCRPPRIRRSGRSASRELVEVFSEQAAGLIDGGADLLIIETAQDILEVKAAIFGAREAFKSTGRTLPIHTSVSLLPNGGKMLLGTDISAVLTTLEALKVDVIGLNCSTGPGGHARRDPLPRRVLPGAGRLHPERRACRCRAPTARRSSPSSPSRWPRR